MGRRLWGVFRASGRCDGAVHARVLTITTYARPVFGREHARAIGARVRRGLAAAEDVDRFLRQPADLEAARRSASRIPGVAYAGRCRSASPISAPRVWPVWPVHEERRG